VKPLVFNATPLIYLTKVGLSKVLEDLEAEKLTSPEVRREVVDEGKRKGVPDAIILESMFKNNVFEVVEPRNRSFLVSLLETKRLHITDAEVLAIARERDGMAVIDDEVARKTARIYRISYAGTPYILMRAVGQGLVTKARAKQALNEMVFAGWRCSVESYARVTDAIEKLAA
jgi:predicted nucleic acid-binding protein